MAPERAKKMSSSRVPSSIEPAAQEIAQRRDKDGATWAELERQLRAKLTSLSPEMREREISLQKRFFILRTGRNHAAERRQHLVDEALAVMRPSERKQFIELMKKNWT